MSSKSKIRNPKLLDDLASKCIRCGFCLESCPTFVVSGKETESPRGRIYLARSAEAGLIDWEDARDSIQTCLGCRACETACPSGVEYNQLLGLARHELEHQKPHIAKQALIDSLSQPGSLKWKLKLGSLLPGRKIPRLLSRLLSGESPQAEKPRFEPIAAWPNLDEKEMPPVRGQMYLLEGCAMRVLFPRVHQATRRLLRRVGYQVKESQAGCCGALHAHSGFLEPGEALAEGVMAAMPGDLPLVVNSAGCGSHLKDLGSTRTVDLSEFLVEHGFLELASTWKFKDAAVRATYHDACHLAHGQGIRQPPRDLITSIPNVDLVPLHEAEMCCGSGGIYNLTNPGMARELLERKWANIRATHVQFCVLANPGCHAWIAQAARERESAIQVLHLAEFLEGCFSGFEPWSNEKG